ncbi:Alpha/beta hydrolase fold protein [Trypanosoma rangeli]|uniref:Alpha/beta hydrolase fold protein n=1 Tax=Trypanosoma rangeli TaxID=5698 RepID=A0A422N2H5_TRYRA|nr:Alpha/beta hydrolase fold protein [Trypanosoma rangeli]RNE99643.1 Alpha/beta hydrolase fold protein [Trypanosoma rangeli]|eukprot:RNE99643.1 Alpha/beta hydrolase fold protein [Trypanosoma rangeli]
MTELHAAAEVGDVWVLNKLRWRSDIDVNAVDAEGRTTLHIAAAHGRIAFIKALLTKFKSVDTCILDKNNKTALQLAPPEVQRQMTLFLSLKEAKALERCTKDNEEKKEEENVYKDNDVESAEMVNPRVLRKAVMCVLLPFIILIFLNGTFFALQFIIVTLAFYFVSLGYFVSEISIRPPWYHHHPKSTKLTIHNCPDYWNGCIHDPLTDLGLMYDDVSFTSTDSYTLRGWHVPPPAENARKMGLVLVHGGGRDRRAWLRHVPFLHQAGYGCLLFDFREHGLSDGNMRGFTYGMKERFDVVVACQFMRSNYKYERICAMGTSVGGSSVIMAAAIDKSIDAIIAENALLTCATLQDQKIVEMIGGYFSRRAYSMFFFNLFRRTSSLWLNFRIGNKPTKHCQALHCIGKISPRPILLMHGTADELVPYRHSLQLYDAAQEPKELYISEGAFHCGLHNTHKEEYEERVINFLQKYGGEKRPVEVGEPVKKTE